MKYSASGLTASYGLLQICEKMRSRSTLEKFVHTSRTTDRTAIGVILRDWRVDGIVFVAVWINIEADLLSNNPAALAVQKR